MLAGILNLSEPQIGAVCALIASSTKIGWPASSTMTGLAI